ncbi:MAG: HAD family hydrolase [Saccharolobus sp.]
MPYFAVWLDGVILKIDLTDRLYQLYKGEKVPLDISYEVNEDWKSVYEIIKDKLAILSPYDESTTKDILNNIKLEAKYIVSNKGKTKPSLEPYKLLFDLTKWDPLDVITLASSPLDLLSARFFDSRIKVVCIKRFRDCSRYSPFFYAENLITAINSLKKLHYI